MKGIPMKDWEVRAILADRKTVTRRVVKPQPPSSTHPNLFVSPPYRPGDILYVRETFRIDYLSNIPGTGRVHYKADDTYCDFTFAIERYEMMRRAQLKPGWRPNENMPRESARIFLRVTNVRVERLQEITHEGVAKEGIVTIGSPGSPERINPFFAFSNLWDSALKPADRALYGWDANPWVWVIEFERCEKPKEGVS